VLWARRLICGALVAFTALPASAGLRIHGSGSTAPIGGSQANIEDLLQASDLIDVFNVATVTPTVPSDAGLMDADGYFNGTLAGNVGISFPNSGFWTNTQYELRFPAGFQGTLHFNANATSCTANVNVTVSGCTGSGPTDFSPTTNAGGSVQFTTNSTQLSAFWLGGVTYAHTAGTKLSLYRVSDKTAYQAGAIWTPELIARKIDFHAKTNREMQIMQFGASGFNGETNWKYRTSPTSFGWQSNHYPPSLWSGGSGTSGAITGTNQYTAAAATDTPLSGWVNGEQIIGAVANASAGQIAVSGAVNNGSGLCRLTASTTNITTGQAVNVINLFNSDGTVKTGCNGVFNATVINSTTLDLQASTFNGTGYLANSGFVGIQTLTITGKTGGAKFIVDVTGLPRNALFLSTVVGAGLGTFTYDDVLDVVKYNQNGIGSSAAPIEAVINLSNSTNANIWANVPPWATDDYVNNWGANICSGLNPWLFFYQEYSNELWNPGFPQWQWALRRGLAFGWVASGGQANEGWVGLRFRQIAGNLIPAIPSCAARMSTIRRVLAYQGGGDPTQVTNLFGGAQLNTTTGNALYCTYTGGTWSGSSCSGGSNYSVKPNRPIDVAESEAPAPYVGGVNLCTGPDVGCTLDTTNAPFYQALANAWEAGNTAAAIALVDNDFRQATTLNQTVTAAGSTFTTPSAHGFSSGQFGTYVLFTTTGTLPTGLALNTLYNVTSTPTSNTFTVRGLVNGFPAGSNITVSGGSGTMSVGSSSQRNLMWMANAWYPFFENNAAAFDGDRPAGMANVRVEWYEGNIELQGPATPSVCTTMGVTSPNPAIVNFTGTTSGNNGITGISSLSNLHVGMVLSGAADIPAGTYITGIGVGAFANLDPTAITISANATGSNTESITATGNCASDAAQAIIAWKNDNMSELSQIAYYKQFFGTDASQPVTFGLMPHARTPAQLVMFGECNGSGGSYSMMPGCLANSTPYVPYYSGFSTFNSGFN